MNADERRRLERQVKEYNQNKKEFEEAKDKSLISKTLESAGKIAKPVAIVGGGLFLAKRGWESYGRQATKSFLGSKSGAGFISTINKRLDDMSMVSKAFNETARSTGLLNTMAGKSNKELATKLAYNVTSQASKPSGMLNIKSPIEKIASEYANVKQDIMYNTIRGVQKDEFVKKVLSSATEKKYSKRDISILEKAIASLDKNFNRSETKSMFTAGGNKNDSMNFIQKIMQDMYKDKSTGKLPESIFDANGTIDAKILNLLTDKADEVKIGADFMSRKMSPISFYKAKGKTDDFLNNTIGVKAEIENRYNNLMSQYNKSMIEILKPKDSDAKELMDKAIDFATSGSYKLRHATDTIKNSKQDIGIRPLTIKEAKEKNLLNYEVLGSQARRYENAINTETVDMSKFVDELEDSVSGEGMSIMDSVFDKNIFINDADEIIDLRAPKSLLKNAVNTFADNVQVPFLNFNPVKLVRDMFTTPGDMPLTSVFKHGEYMPSLNTAKTLHTVGDDIVQSTVGLTQNYYYFGGKVFDQAGSFVKEGYLYHSDRGLAKNTFSALVDTDKKQYKNKLFELLDLGNQADDSELKKVTSVISKFNNPNWQKNMLYSLDNGLSVDDNYDYANKIFKSFYTTSLNSAKPLTSQQLEAIKPMLKNTFEDETFIDNLLNGATDMSVMDSITFLLNGADKKDSRKMFLGKLQSVQKSYAKNPEKFSIDEITRVSKQEEWSPSILDSIKPNKYDNITKLDEAKIYLHAEVLNRVEKQLTSDYLRDGVKDVNRAYEMSLDYLTVTMGGNSSDAVKPLMSLSYLQGVANNSKYIQGDDVAKDSLNTFLRNMHQTADENVQGYSGVVRDVINDNNSILDYGPDDIQYNPFSRSDNIFVGKSQHGIKQVLSSINSRITMGENAIDATLGSVMSNVPGFVKELGFGAGRAGRDNLSDMSRAGMVSYQMGARLNTMLSSASIGLSHSSMGSAQDIWANIALKRIVAPMAIGGYALYANDLVGAITGEKPTQTVGQAYATTTVGAAGVKEFFGVNDAFENLDRLMPGASKVFETPIGKAVETLTFGIIGNSKSGKEQVDYLTNGYDSVRKGRWWSIGSNTPIWGDRIKYWQPSWYRRSESDYKYTDTYYGDGMERWNNSMLPNPHNILGAANPFTWNHYEKKHYDDRPYPVTRSMFANIPLVGDVLDQTIGRVTTPFRKRPDFKRQHEQYLKDINMLTAYYGASQTNTQMQISPGGRMTPVTISPQQGGATIINGSRGSGATTDPNQLTPMYGNGISFVGEAGLGSVSGEMPLITAQQYLSENQGATNGVPMVSASAPISMQMQSIQSGSSYISAKNQVRQTLTEMNKSFISEARVNKVNVGAIASLKNKDFADDLDNIANPNSVAHGMVRTLTSLQDIEGIYGWMSGFATGNPMPRNVLASSNNMMSISRSWWDNEMGGSGFGLPGAEGLSELYRRFIPRPNKGQRTYNPIRNTMPDWLPGPEYFFSLKHGDPYAAIPKGELRLPGEAYEASHKLHSDEAFGKYGIVDRLLILSDVAPYSEQYGYYKKVATRMHDANMIDEDSWKEIQDAKLRVRETKKKQDFHGYKFKTAEVEKRKVTVTKVLDDNTFMVDEMPNTPLKLAGLSKLPKGDTGDKANRIRELIHETIRPGETITVALGKDAMNAYNSDVKGTMDASVYIGRDKTLNREIAKISSEKLFGFTLEESPLDVKWDSEGPTDVASLYTTNEQKMGRAWEGFSHMNTPFHTKFLQLRSPLEMYKRKEIYGKQWQSWDRFVPDWIVPIGNNITQASPIAATATGAMVGFLAGTTRHAKGTLALAGAILGGGASSLRTVGEAATRMWNFVVPNAFELRDTYIPKRRKTERYLNEYFDKLKYVKYMGLYEKTRQLAIEKEGLDPAALIEATNLSKKDTKNKRKILNAYKKMNGIGGLSSDHNKVLNDALEILDGKKSIVDAGNYTMKALEYYEEATRTVYGVDPSGDVSKIHTSLPKKDRAYYQEFLKAGPKEREEILRLVPEDQKKFYQAAWGMDVDKQESIESFFTKNYLPDASWEGWSSDVAIDDIKIKFLDKVGQELSEYGYWKDDAMNVKNAPKMPRGISSLKTGDAFNAAELQKVLSGMGLERTDITSEVEYSNEPFASPVEISMALDHDRREEVKDKMNTYLPDILQR